MYIKNKEVADFFGIKEFENSKNFEAFGQNLELTTNDQENIILLGQERTLYDYKLKDISKVYSKIGERVLMTLCQWLTDARWNGDRKWINTQSGISNFNVNIFTTIPQFDRMNSVWSLQEQISTAIAKTLTETVYEWKISIAYPFHYLVDEKKIAGHLIQAASIDAMHLFVRIGIWMNSTTFCPKLPDDDQLAKYIFNKTSSICMPPSLWINFANWLAENITASIESGSKHAEYLQLLNIQPGNSVSIFEDNGTTQFWEQLAQWKFMKIDSVWSIKLDTQSLASWRDYHIIKTK
jgi:biotin-(acetyl-CoA carboxylase) ligase